MPLAKPRLSALAAAVSLALLGQSSTVLAESAPYFERIASFPVFLNTDIEQETVAEIVAASTDGTLLIYTDSEGENVGFVDIADPAAPQPAGTVALDGEPTSVAVVGNHALVAVNTSANYVDTSGQLVVIDLTTRTIVATHALGGQPDSVAVSPDRRYAAIAIENERDEDLGDGEPPQAPPGFLAIVDLVGAPAAWTLRQVDLEGVADLFPGDPEPEYVSINRADVAAVTLQENNHIVLVNLRNGKVTHEFSAGSVDLSGIDTDENDLIEQTAALAAVPREPDGVAWINSGQFATADEGDLFGGSRGFSLFDKQGRVLFSSGNALDRLAARLGHYPEDRSENKGNETENVAFAEYGTDRLLFVGSERSSLVFVYTARGVGEQLRLRQTLPTGVGPEGLLPIPQRGLFVAAAENDARDDKYRSVLSIYRYGEADTPAYPTVVSADRADGSPIPWGALSGLAYDLTDAGVLYAVHDSFYQKSRIYRLHDGQPATIGDELVLRDNGALAAVDAGLVNPDMTVNLDLEGIATRRGGGFWVVSEGAGTVGDPSRPVESPNLLLQVAADGTIEAVHTLPASTNGRQVRFGFEGVSAVGQGEDEAVFVAFQREWADDPDDHVRIGRFTPNSGEWAFYYYPLEAPQSANGGWVGLSEIAAVDDQTFAVVERDDQAGPDAVIKRIYRFSVAGLTPLADPAVGTTPGFPVVEKTLVRDLMPDLEAPGGQVLEKIEGLAVSAAGDAVVVNDNDGVDDSNGETQLIHLPGLF
jgi:DNA-binding beta-propeller fold protein YncE